MGLLDDVMAEKVKVEKLTDKQLAKLAKDCQAEMKIRLKRMKDAFK